MIESGCHQFKYQGRDMASFSDRTSTSGSAPSESSLQLLNAAREGNATLVESLLDRPPEASSVDINVRGEGQMTPLHLAAEGNHHEVLTQLLTSSSVEINAQDDLGRTPLIIAAQRGLTKVAKLLQDAGANFLLCAQGGYTSLHVAAWHGHSELVDLLLGICEPQEFGYGNLAGPEEKLKKSSKNSHKNASKDVPSSQDKRCRLFGNFGPALDRPLKPLFKTASHPECGDCSDLGSPVEMQKSQPIKSDVLRLLEATTSAELLTPLHLAAGNGHHRVVVSLLQAYGRAVGITEVLASVLENGGKEALNMVITSIVRILNSHGDMYSSDDDKTEVLNRALGTILSQGCDFSSLSWSSIDAMVSYVNQKDCIGRTPLHYASWEQHVEVVEKLLKVFMVNVNATDMDGFAPLHLCSWKGSQPVVELLVAHDSKFHALDPNASARQNKSTRGKIVEVKRMQQKLGSIVQPKTLLDSIFAEDRDGMTALHYAVEGEHEAIVAALAGLTDINVFVMATPVTKPSVMEGLAPGDGEEKSQTPLTMAFSTNNGDVLLKLLKSGKRNKLMQDLQMQRGYVFKSSNLEENRKIVKEYHRKLLKTAVGLVKLDVEVLESNLFLDLETELGLILNTLLHKPASNSLTLLHHAAFAGLSTELELLLSVPDVACDINIGDVDKQTALHFATMEGETAAVKVLANDKALRPNEEDRKSRTPLQLAAEKGWRDIVSLLMSCPDVKLAMEKLYKDRGANDNAANAILVVAALIASVTFAGWLQPPMGLRQYYNLKPVRGDPPGTIESYAAVQQNFGVQLFWVFNSLSFFLAMCTVISGAAEVIPMRGDFIGQEVRMVRGGLVRTAFLLVQSIVCVLVAFTAAGYASLPPIDKYHRFMFWTTLLGANTCFSMLIIFGTRMASMLVTDSGYHKLKWWRWRDEDIDALPVGKVIWGFLKFSKLIPETYTRFESRSEENSVNTLKGKLFWHILKIFKLDREEYWRQHVY